MTGFPSQIKRETYRPGNKYIYNSKQSEFQWFEFWIAHWAKQPKLDLKRRRLFIDLYDEIKPRDSTSRALSEMRESVGPLWLKKKSHKNYIFHQPDLVTYSRWVADPNWRVRYRLWFRLGRRPYWNEMKVSRFTSVRLSPFFFLCCRFPDMG